MSAAQHIGRPAIARLVFTAHAVPVPKARARVVAGGRMSFTPKRTRDYETYVRSCAELAVSAHGSWPRTNEGGYRLRVAVYRAANRGDLDNLVKGVSDALNRSTALDDDRRIVELHALMFVDKEDPRVFVELEALT